MAKHMSLEKQEAKVAIAFLTPYIVGLLIFSVIPIIYSFFISFMDFNSLGSFKNLNFIGLKNYVDVLTDSSLMQSFVRSFYYTIVFVPVIIIFSLIFAMAINKEFKFKGTTRTMILMPYVSNTVAVAIVWAVILNPYDGPVNALLKLVGIANPPMWLSGIDTALVTATLIAVWQNLAFQIIVYLAALQEVPGELYESAHMDGANKFQTFLKVTLPCISPTTFFLIVSSIIGSTQNFGIINALTKGGPGDATQVAAVSIYKNAFEFNRYSVASSQAILLFIVLLIITIIQWRGQKKWVNY